MGWISALASVAGSMIGAAGQSGANATNVYLQRENQQWQEHMANTAMQRRVEDLKGAGLNPLLAVNQSGADTPSVASAHVDNPKAAYAGLGSQIAQAIQTSAAVKQADSQANLNNANAAKVRSETPGSFYPVDDKGEPDFTHGDGGVLGNLTAQRSYQELQNAKQAWNYAKAQIENTQQQTTESEARTRFQNVSTENLKKMQDAIIKKAQGDADISAGQAEGWKAEGKIMKGNTGVILQAIRAILGLRNML